MTNGEKIQTILDIDKDCTEVYGKNGMMTFSVPQDWWNAEYKEPTTKNNLGVDCISRDDVRRVMQELWGTSGELMDRLMDLPSVTPQPCEDAISRKAVLDLINADWKYEGLEIEINNLPSVTPQPRWIPASEKYEHHIDHTDCIWYGNDSGCPVTCSQYRDGWNDAMEYIFKDGKGYQPYRREE